MRELILASQSLRRLEILNQCGIKPRVISSKVDEIINEFEKPEQIVMSLAFKKALDVSNRINTGIILGADTLVVIGDTILGKPKDEFDARKMLESLSGKSHKVITGFCLIDPLNNIKSVDYETSEVLFHKLSKDQINSYIETREYQDKAGSYAIQGKGALLVEKISGCYFNIVGLPISKINQTLNQYFNYNLL